MKRAVVLILAFMFGASALTPYPAKGQVAEPAALQDQRLGWITRIYDAEMKSKRPDWVTQALNQSLAHLRQKQVSRDTGLRNVDADLTLRSARQDDLGQTHLRLDQVTNGVPIFGGQITTHLDQRGRVRVLGRIFKEAVDLDTTPALAPLQAIAAAKAEAGYEGRLEKRFEKPPTAKLVILPHQVIHPNNPPGATLVYLVELLVLDGTEETARHFYFIDADTGAVTWYYNNLQSQISTGWGYSLYSGTVSFRTYRLYTAYYLQDNTKCVSCPYQPSWTSDMRGSSGNENGNFFIDPDNVWGNGSTSNPQSAGVDAHFGMSKTWDYYYLVHGRRGIDGNGFQMISRTHYGVGYNNAFWDGLRVTFGDGDGSGFRPLVSLDIAGHEWTHGLTEKTAGLIYAGESGGSNESFSDIFGTAIEFYAGINPDYLIGEDPYTPATPGDALRYMFNPRADGFSIDHYSQYFPGIDVHFSSGIQNVAFYLLAEGGNHPTSGAFVPAIGRAAAERIFYRALTIYLFPSATFSNVRAATLSAAADLYGAGGAEYNATAAAWNAVGVP